MGSEMLDESKRNRYYPESSVRDFIDGMCDELAFDGISAFGIWADARLGFALSEADIEAYARLAIISLLDAGAVPATTDTAGPDFFRRLPEYEGDPPRIVDQIIEEWKAMGHDPDHGWIWFYRFG